MKKNSNYIKLEFLSRSTNEGFARSAVAAFASQLDPTLDELDQALDVFVVAVKLVSARLARSERG